MLIWGYAKLDRVPAAELLHRCMQHFEQRLPMYQHQATANMFFSLARLRQFSPRLCQAVQAQAAARIDEFSAQVITGRHGFLDIFSIVYQQLTAKNPALTMCNSCAGAPEYAVGLCEVSVHAV
jgi:hypothetical protein